MGKIDTYTKPYLTDCGRFAELFNVTSPQGKQKILPEELKVQKGTYPSLATKGGEKERDILMDYLGKIRYGLELESASDITEPECIMHYDVCDYEMQIRGLQKENEQNHKYKSFLEKKNRMLPQDRLIPVITKVLYLGEGKWQGKTKLSELCDFDEEILASGKSQDYCIDVIESESVNPESFQTDLREFFESLQSRRNRKKLKELFQSERYQILSRDARLAIAANIGDGELLEKVEEGRTMCQALQELLAESKEEGIGQGIEQGTERMMRLIAKLTADGEIQLLSQLPTDRELLQELYKRYGV